MKMKNAILAGAAALAMIGAVAPATAQGWNNNNPAYNNGGWNRDAFWRDAPASTYDRISFLQQRIDRGVADGSLNRREVRQSQTELNEIRRMADQYRYRNRGRLSASNADLIQARLDNLSQRLRWQRRNGGAYAWESSPQQRPDDWNRRYATNYDASRYYRDSPQYAERRLTANDEVYRGSDGRYYCKRNDGTTGLIAGGVGGGVIGNLIDGGHNRVAGTLIGGALGALAGKAIDQSSSDVRCR
jgi:hypothetical protein